MICVTNVINPPFYSQSNTQNMFVTLITISLIFKKLGVKETRCWTFGRGLLSRWCLLEDPSCSTVLALLCCTVIDALCSLALSKAFPEKMSGWELVLISHLYVFHRY